MSATGGLRLMSAVQTLCDAFEYLASGVDCPYDACEACPIYQAARDDEGSCQETFARLLRESRGEPWRGRVRKVAFSRSHEAYCSLCGGPLEDGAGECPTCGAIIARGAEARSDGRCDESVSPYQKNGETSRETARESLGCGVAIR